MRLTPREIDRLVLFQAAELSRRRQARGLRLNAPEAMAIIADEVSEAARDGATLAEARVRGERALGPDDVLPGVADLIAGMQVEALFDDGSRLVVLPRPIEASLGSRAPGAVVTSDVPLQPPPGEVTRLSVENTAPVTVAVTSHFHFFEANPRLRFDRAAAYGRRLAIPAGTSIRFLTGHPTTVDLIPMAGHRVAIGFAGLVDGPLDAPGAREAALRRAAERGYLGVEP